MLGKLMKYELKATARWFLPIYAAIVVFAIIIRFFIADPSKLNEGFSVLFIIQTITIMTFFVLVFGIIAVTVTVIIQRFYKSLLGNEGYLMFTLPVKPWQHIASKLVIATVWFLLSGAIGFGSILLILPPAETSDLFHTIGSLFRMTGTGGYFTTPVLAIVTIAFSILQMYTAIALGHLFNKHKLLASFGMYIGTNVLQQFASMLILPLVSRIMVYASFTTSFRGNTVALPSPGEANTMIMLFTVFYGILAAAYFVLTNMILKKRLNLE